MDQITNAFYQLNIRSHKIDIYSNENVADYFNARQTFVFRNHFYNKNLIYLHRLYGIQAWHWNSAKIKISSPSSKKTLPSCCFEWDKIHTYTAEVHVTADKRSDWQTDSISQALLTFFTAKFPSVNRIFMVFFLSNVLLNWVICSFIT